MEVGDHGLRWHLPIRQLELGNWAGPACSHSPTCPLSEKSVHFPWIRNLPHKGGPECNRACKVVILSIFLIQDSDQLKKLDDDDRLLKVLLGMQTVLMSWFKVGKLCGSERGALIVSIMFHDLVLRNNATTMES